MAKIVFDNGIRRTEFPDETPGKRGFDLLETLNNDSKINGILEGIKVGLLAGAAGAVFNKAQGQSATKGALIAGVPAALVAGLVEATKKKIKNMDEEAHLRYYADRIKDEEPYFFLPKQPYLREIIVQNAVRGGVGVHRKNNP